MAYATTADFTTFLDGDPLPAHAARLLDRASELVDEMLVGAVYATDSAGFPTHTRVVNALKKATMLQAQYLAAVGDETGAKDGYASVSTGQVSFTRATKTGGATAVARFAPAAVTYLRTAGVLDALLAGRW